MRKYMQFFVVLLGLLAIPATASALEFSPAADSPLTVRTQDPMVPDSLLYPPPGYMFQGQTTADFDNDGFDDIAVMSISTKDIYLFLGSQDGTLEPSASNPIGSNSPFDGGRWELNSADMDQDGDVDIVAGSTYGTTTFEVYLNGLATGSTSNAHESFGTTPSGSIPLGGAGVAFYSESIADVTGDGYPEVVVGLQNSDYTLLVNDGDGGSGGLSNPDGPVTVPGGASSIPSTALGDFDGNGTTDLALIQQTDDYATPDRVLFAGRVDETHFDSTPKTVTESSRDDFGYLEVADLNGDIYDDLVFTRTRRTTGSAAVETALGSPTGLVINSGTNGSFASFRPGGAVVADFDNDGKSDVANPKKLFVGALVDVALGDGEGGISLSPDSSFDLAAIGDTQFYPEGIEAFDMNGDGLQDLAVNSAHQSDCCSRGVDILLNVPDPGISVAPNSVDFGNVPENAELIAPRQVTIKSTGTGPLALGNTTITGSSSKFSLDPGTCSTGKVLQPQESCALAVTFVQNPGLGQFMAELNVPSDGTDTPVKVPLTVNVTGDTLPPGGSPNEGAPNLSLKLKAPKKAKKGKKAVVTATVTNSGTATSASIVLKATGPKKSIRKVKTITVGPLDPAGSVTRKFKVPVKRTARGRFKVKVSMSSDDRTVVRSTGRIKVVRVPARR